MSVFELIELSRKCEELEAEKIKLSYQVTELMEYVAWLGGFERSAMHESAWDRRRELLQRLANSGEALGGGEGKDG
jgi:hypothetical protein